MAMREHISEPPFGAQQLAAFEEIRLVKARYCRFLDTHQWDEFARLFCKDARLTFYDVRGAVLYTFSNLEAFLASTREALAEAHSIHQVHNSEIELMNAGSARAIWSMEDRITYTDGHQRAFNSLRGFGHYHDTFQYRGGRWLIKTLELKRTLLCIA